MDITKENYRDFLRSIDYPECKIREILASKFDSGLDGEYPHLDSNIQIKTIMEIVKTMDIIYYRVPSTSVKNRLVEILCKKNSNYASHKMVENLLDGKFDKDLNFYETLKREFKRLRKARGKSAIPARLCDPRQTFAQSIYYHLVPTYLKKDTIKDYLDLGAGDGFKTHYLAREFSLEKDNVIGLDFTSYGSVDYLAKRNKNVTFVDYESEDVLKYPFKNSSFDLVSAFMVAHHIKDLDSFFKEINRIVKKGKYFLLADHNNVNMLDKMLTDVEHAMYETVYKRGEINLEYLRSEYTRYYDMVEWSVILEKHGFKLVTMTDYSNNLASTLTSTLGFFALYKKL